MAAKRTTSTDELAPYAERLRTLPFVRGARARDGGITLTTPTGKFDLVIDAGIHASCEIGSTIHG